MTSIELGAIALVEKNRGVIKNAKKYHPMVCDILKLSINDLLAEATHKKRFGIEFIHNLATDLTHKEQDEFLERVNAVVGLSKSSADIIFMDIVLNRGK